VGRLDARERGSRAGTCARACGRDSNHRALLATQDTDYCDEYRRSTGDNPVFPRPGRVLRMGAGLSGN